MELRSSWETHLAPGWGCPSPSGSPAAAAAAYPQWVRRFLTADLLLPIPVPPPPGMSVLWMGSLRLVAWRNHTWPSWEHFPWPENWALDRRSMWVGLCAVWRRIVHRCWLVS